LFNLVCENQTKYTINTNFLQEITNFITNKEIELIVCHNDYIKEINFQYRQIDKPTDVLSFPLKNMPNGIEDVPLGSIIISVDFVLTKSKELNHTFDEELALLFIHGLLHLDGYDHECDNGEHREKEKELIKQFKLPNSLIVRTEKG
jgi:probable rRNA maturation factor